MYISSQTTKALLPKDVVETPRKFTNEQWKAAQRADAVIAQVLNYLQKHPDIVHRKLLTDEVHGVLRQRQISPKVWLIVQAMY